MRIYLITSDAIGILLAIYVITISFTRVGDKSFKWYSVNMYIASIPCSITIIVHEAYSTYMLYEPAVDIP